MRVRFIIWVTSDCTLSCKHCNQGYTISQNRGYQMTLTEVKYIVNSCKERGIHFGVIELGGGEPSLWVNLKKGVKLFKKICDEVYLTTNGNNPELIMSLGLNSWTVSSSQATRKQLAKYRKVRKKILFNGHPHKELPQMPVVNSLPAVCCVKFFKGIPENCISYIRGNCFYCCLAFSLSGKAGLSDSIVCRFEDDFLSKFSDKTYNEKICSYCVCNGKVY